MNSCGAGSSRRAPSKPMAREVCGCIRLEFSAILKDVSFALNGSVEHSQLLPVFGCWGFAP